MHSDRFVEHGPEASARFDEAERQRWLGHAAHLLRHVKWESARDVDLTDAMRFTIAAHGAVLAAGFEPTDHPFHNIAAVIVHEGAIKSRERRFIGHRRGVVHGSPATVVGLSSPGHGPLVFDWRTIEHNLVSPDRGHNVIYHEFAHKLDQLNGAADGMPPLPSNEAEAGWIQTLGTNFRRLRRRGSDGLIRAYGATNEAEYFAVTTEVFFTRPDELRERLPRVYDRLSGFYRQDPAASATH